MSVRCIGGLDSRLRRRGRTARVELEFGYSKYDRAACVHSPHRDHQLQQHQHHGVHRLSTSTASSAIIFITPPNIISCSPTTLQTSTMCRPAPRFSFGAMALLHLICIIVSPNVIFHPSNPEIMVHLAKPEGVRFSQSSHNIQPLSHPPLHIIIVKPCQ